MNNKQFTRQLIGLTAVSVAIMSGLVIHFQLFPGIQSKYPLVPTKPIDKSQSIGGQPEKRVTQHIPPAPSAAAPETTPQSQSKTILPSGDVSPRQTAIAATVTHEYTYHALASPNDPYYPSSWALQHTGATGAWAISTGTPMVIAIIDTGFALSHEDLQTQWYQNQGENGFTQSGDRCWTGVSQNKSTNSCDDDANGYIDDWRGWNFVNKSNLPQAGTTNPTGSGVSHGTAVAGIAGAATNNGIGVASYNWNVKLMPLQALSDNGSGVTSDIAAAIYYAVDNGASVINLSLGGSADDPALKAAVLYAYQHNVVIVAAAGNCGTGTESGCDPSKPGQMLYPALYDHVISVGATDVNDARASFSSYGPALDVIAPGSGNITSTLIDTSSSPINMTNAYSASLYGTSFASPMVASIVSLIKSIRPNATVEDITALVDGSAQKVSGMSGSIYTLQYGHGLINATSASTIAASLSPTATTVKLGQTGSVHSEHSFNTADTLASSCTVSPFSYCTVRIHSVSLGYDRYLPYTKTDSSGITSWSWPGNIISASEAWDVSGQQGGSFSPYYPLVAK
ncbi:S8 family serine peptidase [Candidatus Saccharibacteria bacterium]|nr:MAG: S8 family serine peptidase [Candidatus Saccharibacteria bacterium]